VDTEASAWVQEEMEEGKACNGGWGVGAKGKRAMSTGPQPTLPLPINMGYLGPHLMSSPVHRSSHANVAFLLLTCPGNWAACTSTSANVTHREPARIPWCSNKAHQKTKRSKNVSVFHNPALQAP
jgi:hypothetical protein